MTARFIVLYETPADPAAFDRHYRDVHLPLVRRLPGLRCYTLGRDAVAVRGGEPYYLVAELEWDTMEELRAAFASSAGRATAADSARLQELTPVRSMIYTVDESVL
ncbi:EthD family reductase [Streptomyces sp. NPDC091217]|uniref:EthD family reductase n=1 Tax=Streptomyces sp. NPDC091217 TaxID=3365975 RepID=UPI00382EC01D